MYSSNTETTRRCSSGELKIIIVLRFLGDGDAMDIRFIFDITSGYCTQILYELLLKWIIKPNIGDLSICAYIEDEDKDTMARVNAGFRKKSDGVLNGFYGVLDAWMGHIVRPGMWDYIKHHIVCMILIFNV